jgi:hypothetical protein
MGASCQTGSRSRCWINAPLRELDALGEAAGERYPAGMMGAVER